VEEACRRLEDQLPPLVRPFHWRLDLAQVPPSGIARVRHRHERTNPATGLTLRELEAALQATQATLVQTQVKSMNAEGKCRPEVCKEIEQGMTKG